MIYNGSELRCHYAIDRFAAPECGLAEEVGIRGENDAQNDRA